MNQTRIVAALRELLAAFEEDAPTATTADLTIAELAAQLHRAPSTVRGWVEAGRFADAYKLNRRDWRVPRASLAAFLAGQRPPPVTSLRSHLPASTRPTPRGKAVGLGAWRDEITPLTAVNGPR